MAVMVKRICDEPGCLDWAVSTVTAERDRNRSPVTLNVCQIHLDDLVRRASAEGIPVSDNRHE
jgi:hypothetical protein